MDNAFAFTEQNSVCTEKSYCYTATDGTCASSRGTEGIPHGEVVGCTNVSKDNEQAMMSGKAQQRVSIYIETDQSSFQFYSSGALTASCGYEARPRSAGSGLQRLRLGRNGRCENGQPREYLQTVGRRSPWT